MRIGLFLALATTVFADPAEPLGLGIVYKNEDTALDIKYTNGSAKQVLISQISSSCDCLKPLVTPGLVATNEEKVLPFSYRSAKPGRIDVTVQFQGTQASEVLKTYVVGGFVAERDWVVSVENLRSKQETGTVIIDVRDAKDFVRQHIPKSINIASFALKTRSDYREQRVVLVDDGSAPDRLLESVKELRGKGFPRVSMLNGGLRAWKTRGGAIEGTERSANRADRVMPAEFLHAQSTTRCRVIELIENAEAAPAHWPFKVEKCAGLKDLLATFEEMTAKGEETALIITPSSVAPEKIEALCKRRTAPQTFYLEGGREALMAFVNQQNSLNVASQEVTLARTTSRQVRGSGRGCGTCNRH